MKPQHSSRLLGFLVVLQAELGLPLTEVAPNVRNFEMLLVLSHPG